MRWSFEWSSRAVSDDFLSVLEGYAQSDGQLAQRFPAPGSGNVREGQREDTAVSSLVGTPATRQAARAENVTRSAAK